MPVSSANSLQLGGGAGVDDAAAGVDERLLAVRGSPRRSASSSAPRRLAHRPVAGQVHRRVPVRARSCCVCTSLQMSMMTGPGRPVVAMWNASFTTRGDVLGARARR